jgi:hypothetical protein
LAAFEIDGFEQFKRRQFVVVARDGRERLKLVTLLRFLHRWRRVAVNNLRLGTRRFVLSLQRKGLRFCRPSTRTSLSFRRHGDALFCKGAFEFAAFLFHAPRFEPEPLLFIGARHFPSMTFLPPDARQRRTPAVRARSDAGPS